MHKDFLQLQSVTSSNFSKKNGIEPFDFAQGDFNRKFTCFRYDPDSHRDHAN